MVPDFDKLMVWCRTESIPADTRDAVAAHPKVMEFILAQIESLSGGFAKYERIKKNHDSREGVHDRERGADTDDEGQAQSDRVEIQALDRRDVSRVRHRMSEPATA